MSALQVCAAYASLKGIRESNQDYAGAYLGSSSAGMVAIVADGVGGNLGGREAAEIAVRGFIEAYYELPETLGVELAASRAVAAINRWIYSMGRRDPLLENMATTFSALILRGRQAHVVHVGDTRIYRLRQGRLVCLTRDHNLAHMKLPNVLYRAIGLEEGVRADHAMHTLEMEDRFLLCSDGVHGALSEAQLRDLLAVPATVEFNAQAIAAAALAAGSSDNVTTMVVDVVDLPVENTVELASSITALPMREPPKTGAELDGFRIDAIIADGRYNRLCLAEDTLEHRTVLLKCPTGLTATEKKYHDAFVREAWITRQVRSPWLAEILSLPPGRQTQLYSVMPYYEGKTLAARIKSSSRIALNEGVDIAIKLAKAVYALNRRGIIHRDIKPENVILLSAGGLKLLDFGVARLPNLHDIAEQEIPGTPSYMAPEMFAGELGDEQTDVYALGVTLYHMFSGGHYPYGEVEPFTHPRFSKHTPLTHHRPDLPAWLDRLLSKATATAKDQRLGDAMELAIELENAMSSKTAAMALPKQPLYHRHPVRFWQIISFLLAIMLIITASMCIP